MHRSGCVGRVAPSTGRIAPPTGSGSGDDFPTAPQVGICLAVNQHGAVIGEIEVRRDYVFLGAAGRLQGGDFHRIFRHRAVAHRSHRKGGQVHLEIRAAAGLEVLIKDEVAFAVPGGDFPVAVDVVAFIDPATAGQRLRYGIGQRGGEQAQAEQGGAQQVVGDIHRHVVW